MTTASPYTGWNHRRPVVQHMAPDQKIWMISDLHLGDGTPSDAFFGKDAHLVALLQRIQAEGSQLVIVGDAIDFHQAWTLRRILAAHPDLFRALADLAAADRVTYVIGNHDDELAIYETILRFKVCDELWIGDDIRVVHGWQFDPVLRSQVGVSYAWGTTIHHVVERLLGTWIRVPLGEFYTASNRFAFWMGHKVWWLWRNARRLLGRDPAPVDARIDYWTWGNLGDSMGMFRPTMAALDEGPHRVLVCGHSHMPGIVARGDRTYVNTGTWTFASSHVVTLENGTFTCSDWVSGRRFGDELYRTLLEGTIWDTNFERWWQENYLGWFRFREGEERRGRPRAWELWIRDAQRPAGPWG